MADDQSFLQSHRALVDLVRDAERFAVRLPGVGHIPVPRPEQMAYFAGLAALVAFDMLDWPVAVAIGAGQFLLAEGSHTLAGHDGRARTESGAVPQPMPAH
ncbi:hypothetical protein [Rhodococcus sp. NPDC047139]|uniref:hypothetical protein n=1 Tax=Rhodococcus sp. NPDC047139 TaxID=3155141 RepID=UPI003407372E